MIDKIDNRHSEANTIITIFQEILTEARIVQIQDNNEGIVMTRNSSHLIRF